MRRRLRFRVGGAAVLGVAAACAVALVVVLGLGSVLGGGPAASARAPERPVGIVNAFGPEQAAIFHEMHVTGSRRVGGFEFYEGSIAGRPVVDVAGGEADESAELATYLLDTTFHPRATLFEGTAGAQNDDVHVGDVVLSGFVVDKSTIHYELGGYQQPYDGEQLDRSAHSDVRGAVLGGDAQVDPTPRDAAHYGEGGERTDPQHPFVLAYAAPRQLVSLGLAAGDSIGSTPMSTATGHRSATGSVANHVIAGVVGQADVWTEPLPFIEAQNMLYQTDAEENEGSGFAFANAQLGVPWLIVRGISDSVWYPDAYDGVISSDHAATVVRAIVSGLGSHISTTPETLRELSPAANARRAGYLIAGRAYFTVSAVHRVMLAHGRGLRSLPAARLRALAREYTYAAGRIPAGG